MGHLWARHSTAPAGWRPNCCPSLQDCQIADIATASSATLPFRTSFVDSAGVGETQDYPSTPQISLFNSTQLNDTIFCPSNKASISINITTSRRSHSSIFIAVLWPAIRAQLMETSFGQAERRTNLQLCYFESIEHRDSPMVFILDPSSPCQALFVMG